MSTFVQQYFKLKYKYFATTNSKKAVINMRWFVYTKQFNERLRNSIPRPPMTCRDISEVYLILATCTIFM